MREARSAACQPGPGCRSAHMARAHPLGISDAYVLAPRPFYRHLHSNALGGLLLRAGRVDEAIVRLHEGIAAAREKEIPTDWMYLALAHARKGNLADARRWLDRIRAVPDDSRASFWDSEELALLRGEAGSLLFDTQFPSDPFQDPSP
jgi:hypothetical protein